MAEELLKEGEEKPKEGEEKTKEGEEKSKEGEEKTKEGEEKSKEDKEKPKEGEKKPKEGEEKPKELEMEKINLLEKQVEELKISIETEKTRYKELLTAYQYLAADFDNFRKRVEADKSELANYVTGKLILALMDIFEPFQKALQNVPEEIKLTSFYEGLFLLQKKIETFLQNQKIYKIETIGKPFDPIYHEAMVIKETSDYPEDTVVDEIQSGYLIDDKVLRTAKVIIAKPGTGVKGQESGVNSE